MKMTVVLRWSVTLGWEAHPFGLNLPTTGGSLRSGFDILQILSIHFQMRLLWVQVSSLDFLCPLSLGEGCREMALSWVPSH